MAQVEAATLVRELKDKINTEWMESSENIAKFLTFVNRFHKYSHQNRLLILAQKPEATLCGSFTTWKSVGRKPAKGTGIKIFSPIKKRFPKLDDNGNEMLNADGEKVYVEYMSYAAKFHTFDVSDTEGDEIPMPSRASIDDPEAVDGFAEAMDHLIDSLGIEIEDSALVQSIFRPNGAALRSDLNKFERSIEIAAASCFAQMHQTPDGFETILENKDDQLWVARAASYAVASRYGFDISDYTAENLQKPPADGEKLNILLTRAAELAEAIEAKEAGATNSWISAWGAE